jgi:uncharacterized DUF497 family protein
MDFEWDRNKAQANESKHGVSFEEATEVFADDYSSVVADPDHSREEDALSYSGRRSTTGSSWSRSRNAMIESVS